MIGLSPWFTNIVPWEAIPLTIAAQLVVKLGMQGIAALPLWRIAVARAAQA